MIYSVTLNPAIDYYLDFETINLGKLNAAETAYVLAGGKGINVAKVLKNYGIDSCVLGFIGGFTGEFIKSYLRENSIQFDFIPLEEPSRINVNMNNSGVETQISGVSPKISDGNYNKFLDIFKRVTKDDILILTGSVPSSLPKSVYGDIIERVSEETKVILDARGVHFDLALRKRVYLVKPNIYELEEYFNKKIETEEDILKAGEELRKLGAKKALISLGDKGSVFFSENHTFRGDVPKGELISSIGAGDSMVAGFIYGMENGFDLKKSYRYSIASGSSTAYSKGLTTLENMEKLLDEIIIKEI